MGEKLGELGPLLIAFLLFPLCAAVALRLSRRAVWPALAVLGLLTCYLCGVLTVFRAAEITLRPSTFPHTLIEANLVFAAFIGLILASYKALKRGGSWAYAIPILILVLVREVFPKLDHFDRDGTVLIILGASYVSFRLCYLAGEVANEVVPTPTVWQYLAFACFPPLIFVGPIQPYVGFFNSIEQRKGEPIYVDRACVRILVGIVKFTFLSAVFAELGYGLAFLGDDHFHSVLDLAIAVLLYPVYLFCNFSGLCDIAVGVSGLLGISIVENFDRPFSSRNFQEFWTRWHISLSNWMRVLVFTPLVKNLSRKVKPSNMPHVMALGILASFLLIGLWHGLSSHFVLYGLSQGIGVATVTYWNPWLRKKLGKERYNRLRENKCVTAIGVATTYLYFAATLFLFANTTDQAKQILSHIR